MYNSLSDAANDNVRIFSVLTSDVEHLEAARQINALMDEFSTSEVSVRRWRKKWDEEMQRLSALAEDGELAEDVGDGTGVVALESHVEEGWDGFGEDDREAIHARVDAALDAVNANPDDVAGLRVSTYQSLTKDDEGEAHIHDLFAVKLLVKTREAAPAWPVVQPASPTTIRPVKSSGRDIRDGEIAVILPDPQIGYRFHQDTGEYDPFHDDNAIDVALQIVRDVKPDRVIWLGDFLDLAEFGRYEQEPAFARTTQLSIDKGHQVLAQVRAVAPQARQTVIEGNHDRRLQNMIVANAKAAFGLRQAGTPEAWPVLSVPHLLRFDDLGVEYAGGYPSTSVWVNRGLRCIHGFKIRSGGSTAAAVVKDDHVSTIFGHIHRVETQYLTRQEFGGNARTLVAHSPGALCRIDGAVPSMKGSTTLDGRPVLSHENWQNGLSVVHYEPGGDSFAIESIFIDTLNGHKTRYAGRVYTPSAGS